jgi:hypothetical protein
VTARTPALARLISGGGAGTQASERCGLCGTAIPDDHRHVLAVADRMLHCACRACGLLFEKDAAADGRYRLVPQRRIRLEAGADVTSGLGVPVGLVFLVPQPDGTVVTSYPSPLGVTRSELDPADWQRLTARWPVLLTMTPHVEAVLLNSVRGARECWLVPIDDCYRLVAVIRRHWQGLSGGRDVWPAVGEFFAGLARQHPAPGRETGTGTGTGA